MSKRSNTTSPGGDTKDVSTTPKCPFHTAGGGASNSDWWPNRLNLKILRQNSSLSDPMGEGFDYAMQPANWPTPANPWTLDLLVG